MQFPRKKIVYKSTGDLKRNGEKIMCINLPYGNYPFSGRLTNTSLANIPYMPYLPMATTNYGGDVQVVTIPDYAGSDITTQFNAIAAQQLGIGGLNAFTGMQGPNLNPDALNSQLQGTLAPIYNKYASQNINTALNNINCAKSKLEAKLNDSSTSEEQKTQIKEVLDKLEAKKKEIEELKNSTDLDPETAFKRSNELNNEVNTLLRDALQEQHQPLEQLQQQVQLQQLVLLKVLMVK